MAQAGQLAFAHDTLLPRPPGGNGPGAALALLVHAGLVVALTVAVDWRSKTPEAVSAELWASVPQAAAPRPETVAVPAPPPTPAPTPVPTPAPAPKPPAPAAQPQVREADIAIEREQRRKADIAKQKADADAERLRTADAERKQADAAARKKREQEQREAQAEEARLARQRQENLKRMMGQADAATGTGADTSRGTAVQAGAPSAAYSARVAKLIRDASVFTGSVAGNPAAEVLVRAGPSGAILSRTLVKSSGFKQWDDAVLQAIDKVGSLPRDTDGRVPTAVTIIFRPNE